MSVTQLSGFSCKHYLPIFFNWNITKNFSLNIGPELGYIYSMVTKVFDQKTKSTDFKDPLNINAVLGFNYQIIRNIDVSIRYSNEIPPFSKKYYYLYYYLLFVVKHKIHLPKKNEKDGL